MNFNKEFDKKKFPITILKDLKHFYQFFQQSSYSISTDKNSILSVKEIVEDSNFYFNITRYKYSFWRGFLYEVQLYPFCQEKMGEQTNFCSKEEIIQNFSEWHITIQEYETIKFARMEIDWKFQEK